MKKFLLLLALLTSASYADTCLDKTKVEKEIFSKFQIKDSQKIDLCNPFSPGYRLIQSIFFLSDLGEMEVPKSTYINGIIGKSPYDFFKKRIHKIQLDPAEDCQGVANVHPVEDRKILHVCPIASSFSVLTFSSILIHEARHVDGAEFSHKICLEGENKGQFACDDYYTDKAAYAANTEFLLMVALSKNIDEVTRKIARSEAIQELVSRFNVKPGDLQTGALLIDEDNKPSFFDGKNHTSIDMPVPQNSILHLRAGMINYFMQETGEAIIYSFSDELVEIKRDIVTERFKKLIKEGKVVKDIVYTPDYVCLLLAKEMQCSGKDLKFFTKKFGSITGSHFVYKKKRSQFITPNQAYLMLDEGSYILLPAKASDLKDSNSQNWKGSPTALLSIGDLGYRREEIVLSQSGDVYLYKPAIRKTERALENKKFQKVFAPFVWSKELHQLK